MQNQDLTPKQKKIFDYIKSFRKRKSYSPTLQEIADRFDKTVPTIQQYVDALTEKGYLEKQEKTRRGIRPMEEVSQVFLLGEIAAGEPIEPIENPEPIEIPAQMINAPGNYYALKVKGDSMIEDGIMDEDVIVVKHQNVAESGETVVAITEEGATLKKIKKKNDKIILEPRNKKLKDIYPQQLEIRGKFIGLIRKNHANQTS